jgi:hypothetical protein
MLYKVKVAVCSEIRTKHSTHFFECSTWWYVKKPLGFKRLIKIRVFDYQVKRIVGTLLTVRDNAASAFCWPQKLTTAFWKQ